MVTLCETNCCNTVHRKINDGNSVCQLALLASIAPLLLNTFAYLLVFKPVNVNRKPVTNSGHFCTSMYSVILDAETHTKTQLIGDVLEHVDSIIIRYKVQTLQANN